MCKTYEKRLILRKPGINHSTWSLTGNHSPEMGQNVKKQITLFQIVRNHLWSIGEKTKECKVASSEKFSVCLSVSHYHFAIVKRFHDPFSFLREVKQSLKKNSKEDLWHTLLILDAGSAVNSYSFAPISHIPTKKAESSWNIENGSQQTSTSIRAKISVKANTS